MRAHPRWNDPRLVEQGRAEEAAGDADEAGAEVFDGGHRGRKWRRGRGKRQRRRAGRNREPEAAALIEMQLADPLVMSL